MTPTESRAEPVRRVVRAAIWLPGLAVALGAAVATAHGLYEVAAAARVPAGIAWLYPLITDGLALVAYTATARLHGSAARYAGAVVVLAAGLSGLAQAAYLAGGATLDATPALRFGVGAWPAVAAAIVAHLLYLLATDDAPGAPAEEVGTGAAPVCSTLPVQPEPFSPTPVQPGEPPSGSELPSVVQPTAAPGRAEPCSPLPAAPAQRSTSRPVVSPARDRARAAAARHDAHHGALPTVSELEAIAEVSRGTAATVLKALREHPTPLHLVTETPDTRTRP